MSIDRDFIEALKQLSPTVIPNAPDSFAENGEIYDPFANESEAKKPIPTGSYLARLVSKEFGTSRGGHPQFKMKLELLDPEEFAGRFVYDVLYMTKAAEDITKPKMLGYNLAPLAKLQAPLTATIYVRVHLVDQGGNWLKVSKVEFLKAVPNQAEPFAPSPQLLAPTAPQTATTPTDKPAATSGNSQPVANAETAEKSAQKTLFPGDPATPVEPATPATTGKGKSSKALKAGTAYEGGY